MVKNPQYKVMFGPVSISNDYNAMSRQLIIQFFELHHYLKHKAKLIKPNKRPKMDHNRKRKLKKNKNLTNDFNDLSALISDLEVDDKGIPVLVKQYLKLGGKILAFNVDPDFQNSLDGFIVVDLTETEPAILNRYLGKEGTKKFLAYQSALSEKSEVKTA